MARVDDAMASIEALLSEADAAMYFAKAHGDTGKVQILRRGHPAGGARTASVSRSDLAHALERDELVLHYQPVIEMRTGRTVGVEALVRWNHPERGLLAPAEFLEPAERTGLIVPIGQWVIAARRRHRRGWNRSARPTITCT